MSGTKTKILRSVLFLFLVLTVFLIIGTPRYWDLKVKTSSLNSFGEAFKEKVKNSNEVSIKECTDFQWDELFVFPSYFSQRQVYKIVGKEWTEANTYFGYLMFHNIEHETVNEGQYLIVFKQRDKVIGSRLYVSDNSGSPSIMFKGHEYYKLTPDKAIFSVVNNEGGYKELVLKK